MSLSVTASPGRTFTSSEGRSVPNVVVVDPQFDAYKSLAASARLGRIGLHFRSSGSDALKLARRLDVDAWLIAAELDDMSGHDLVQLLKVEQTGGDQDEASDGVGGRVAIVETAQPGGRHWAIAESDAAAVGADTVMSHPISLADLESLLDLSLEERSQKLSAEFRGRPYVTLPIGVGAAVIAIVVLAMG
jgi:CheY-like chemotaxis protein